MQGSTSVFQGTLEWDLVVTATPTAGGASVSVSGTVRLNGELLGSHSVVSFAGFSDQGQQLGTASISGPYPSFTSLAAPGAVSVQGGLTVSFAGQLDSFNISLAAPPPPKRYAVTVVIPANNSAFPVTYKVYQAADNPQDLSTLLQIVTQQPGAASRSITYGGLASPNRVFVVAVFDDIEKIGPVYSYSPGSQVEAEIISGLPLEEDPEVPPPVVAPDPPSGPSGPNPSDPPSTTPQPGPTSSPSTWSAPPSSSAAEGYTGPSDLTFREGVGKLEAQLADLNAKARADEAEKQQISSQTASARSSAASDFASHRDGLLSKTTVSAPPSLAPGPVSDNLPNPGPSSGGVPGGAMGEQVDINPLTSDLIDPQTKSNIFAALSWLKLFITAVVIYQTYALIWEKLMEAMLRIASTPSASEGAIVAALRTQSAFGTNAALAAIPVKAVLVVASIAFFIGVPLLVAAFLTTDLMGFSFSGALPNVSDKAASSGGDIVSTAWTWINVVFPAYVYLLGRAYYHGQTLIITVGTFSIQTAVRYLNSL